MEVHICPPDHPCVARVQWLSPVKSCKIDTDQDNMVLYSGVMEDDLNP